MQMTIPSGNHEGERARMEKRFQLSAPSPLRNVVHTYYP